jgi:uncharacterized protein (DUF1697 family)
MPVYIAMLRGINVGPHKRMKMEKLRASCEALGCQQVKTYIQSGNVVLQAAKLSASSLAKRIQERIVADFGFASDVILRTREEMQKIIQGNPLSKEEGIDSSKLHVVFLSEAPAPPAVKKLESLTLAPDRVRHSGKEIYFYFPNGVSGSSLWKHNLDRVLSVTGTMRNWNTVNKLNEMASECQ